MTDDLISRKAALQLIENAKPFYIGELPTIDQETAYRAILALPAADALALPEVAAIVGAASSAWQVLVDEYGYQKARVNFGKLEDALAALEARHD